MPDLEPGRIRLWWWSAPALVRAAPVLGGAAALVAVTAWSPAPATPPGPAPVAEAPARSAPPPGLAPPVRLSTASTQLSSTPPVRTSARPPARVGEPCSRPGERAVSRGVALRCVRKPGERRALWRVG